MGRVHRDRLAGVRGHGRLGGLCLGRFALGAAIGRSGILDDVRSYVPLLRRIAWIAIPAGLAAGFVIRLLYTEEWAPLGNSDALVIIAQILRSPAALLLAAGYCAAIVVALQKPLGKRLFGPFGAVGRMALTNYLAQGFIYAFVLYGPPLGLGLAGTIGIFDVLLICVAFFSPSRSHSAIGGWRATASVRWSGCGGP